MTIQAIQISESFQVTYFGVSGKATKLDNIVYNNVGLIS